MTDTRTVAEFINEGWVNARLVYPETGFSVGEFPVFYAAAKPKQLAWAYRGEGQALVAHAYVHELLAVPGGFRCRIDDLDEEHFVEFSRAEGAARDTWFAYRDEIDDGEEEMMAEVAALVAGKGPFVPAPDPTERFEFVRWSAFAADEDGLGPRGVLLRRTDGQIVAFPLPGHEAKTRRWSDLSISGKDGLDQLPQYAGRQDVIAAPETVKATDLEDAARRALYKFAKDHYAETGRSVYA